MSPAKEDSLIVGYFSPALPPIQDILNELMIVTFAKIVGFFDDVLLVDGSQYLLGGDVGGPLAMVLLGLTLRVPPIVQGVVVGQSVRSVVIAP